MQDRIAYRGITFDDVLLEPGYSEILPNQVDVSSQLTRNIRLNVPILSSPMDTVTEGDMAIALAQEGGMGIIHKNMSIERQSLEVDRVKRSEHGVIVDPVTLPPDATVGQASEIMDSRNIGGVPITENGVLKGILTRRDLRFLESRNTRISEVMTRDKLVTDPVSTLDLAATFYDYAGVGAPGPVQSRSLKGLLEGKDETRDAAWSEWHVHPSRLGVAGRYILSPAVFDQIRQQPRGVGNEIQLTDGIAGLLRREKVFAYRYDGKRYDCGSKEGFLQANVELALAHPQLGPGFREFLQGLDL